MQPLVSIIIPTFNRAHLLPQTLDSILAQSYSNWECIVVDDGSTDNSQQVLETYAQKDKRLRCFDRPASLVKGANACRNFGLTKSEGRYINFFDSDDIMLPEFLSEKMGLMIENPSTDFVISRTVNFTENELITVDKYDLNANYALNVYNFLQGNVYWMTPDMLIKREALRHTKFDETLKSAQEANFFLKLLSSTNLSGAFLNSVLTKRRIHQESIQQQIKQERYHAARQRLLAMLSAYRSVYKQLDKKTNALFQQELITSFFILRKHQYPYTQLYKFATYMMRHKGFLKTILFVTIIHAQKIFGMSGYRYLDYIRS